MFRRISGIFVALIFLCNLCFAGLDFDGSDDLVNIPNTRDPLNETSAVTVLVIVFPQTVTANDIFVSYHHITNGNVWLLEHGVMTANKMNFYVVGSDGSTKIANSASAITVNKWWAMCGIYNKVNVCLITKNLTDNTAFEEITGTAYTGNAKTVASDYPELGYSGNSTYTPDCIYSVCRIWLRGLSFAEARFYIDNPFAPSDDVIRIFNDELSGAVSNDYGDGANYGDITGAVWVAEQGPINRGE